MKSEEDQTTFKYLFTITPLEIKCNSKLKNNQNKSILIKLDNQIAKCTQMNTPLFLEIDVLYSKTLHKFCPIKGIIKIYDVAEDGTEIISCVGGFQTEEWLNQGKQYLQLEKEIGTSKLKMDITITNQNKKNHSEKEKDKEKEKEKEKGKEEELKCEASNRSNSKDNKYQHLRKTSLEKTSSHGNNFPSMSSSGYAISQPSAIKPVSSASSTYLSQRITNKQDLMKSTSHAINKSIEKITQALNHKKLENKINTAKFEEVSLKNSEFFAKREEKKSLETVRESELKKYVNEKDKMISQLENRLSLKQDQLKQAENKILQMKESHKNLSEINNYLREKDGQMELILFNKETTIEALKKKLDLTTYELQENQAHLENSTLVIEELKEEVWNLSEVVEKYKEKYGEIKKNRAIELQIKECLLWIDQQNRDPELNEMEETMQSSSNKESNERDDSSLSSVIRNIEIDKVPLEEMSIIRNELLKILEKVDHLLAN